MTKKARADIGWRSLAGRLFHRVRRLLRPATPSPLPGLGATPHGDAEVAGRLVPSGVTFRVWAPHAEQVFVTGSFNGWSRWRTALAKEKDGAPGLEGQGYWSAEVEGAGPGEEYKFVIHREAEVLLRNDPYARRMSGAARNSVVVDNTFPWEAGEELILGTGEGEPYRPPAAEELIIYELHVGTFGERMEQPEGPRVGDFEGVMNKLPYLRELGVNAIELMPVAEFAGDFSWGYNPSQPFAVTESYGGARALQKLVRAAHAHGIAVLIDVVYNHFGPQDLDMWRFDGWHENGKGGIYFYNDWRSKTPWADTRPDYGRREVRQFIRDNAMMWLEAFRADGLRWDATSYIRNAHGRDGDPGADIEEGWQLMQTINRELAERFPYKINIAEDMQGNEWLVAPTEEGGAGFDAQWDRNFVHPVRQAIIMPRDEDRDMTAVAEALAFRYRGDAFSRIIYTESHDEVANGKARVAEEIAPGGANSYFAKKRATLAASLLFTSPGIPMIFQGQEFLESGWFDDTVALDWTKARGNAGILRLYRDLIRLRTNKDGYSRGLLGPHVNVFHVNDEDKVLAYHRWESGGPHDDVVVVANFANQPLDGYSLGFPRPGIWRVRFKSDAAIYDLEFEDGECPDVVASSRPAIRDVDGMPAWGNVALAPYSVLILSQEPGRG